MKNHFSKLIYENVIGTSRGNMTNLEPRNPVILNSINFALKYLLKTLQLKEALTVKFSMSPVIFPQPSSRILFRKNNQKGTKYRQHFD